jgi:tRNA-dihydrouridine synthase A
VPPLNYARVQRLKADRPELEIVINGGIASLDEAEAHLDRVDGAMIGRTAYHNPWVLADVDRRLFGVSQPGRKPQARRSKPICLCGAHACPRRAPDGHDPPCARAVQRPARRPVLPAPSVETAHRPGAGIEVLRRAVERVTGASFAEAA